MTTTSNSQQEKGSLKSKSEISGELAIKITEGDENASNEFVQLNYQWLLFVTRKKFANSNNHEDIVQDAFILVINKLKNGEVHNPLVINAFLRTTAIQTGFEYLRKDKKFVTVMENSKIDSLEDNKPDILSSMIWQDKVSFVKKMISGLKKKRDRKIIDRFYFKDQAKPRICKDLDLSSAHFDRVLFRAKNRLIDLIRKLKD